VVVNLDMDVKVLDSKKASEVEKITKNIVRAGLEGGEKGIKVRTLRTKLLGSSEKLPAMKEEGDYLPDISAYTEKDRWPGHSE